MICFPRDLHGTTSDAWETRCNSDILSPWPSSGWHLRFVQVAAGRLQVQGRGVGAGLRRACVLTVRGAAVNVFTPPMEGGRITAMPIEPLDGSRFNGLPWRDEIFTFDAGQRIEWLMGPGRLLLVEEHGGDTPSHGSLARLEGPDALLHRIRTDADRIASAPSPLLDSIKVLSLLDDLRSMTSNPVKIGYSLLRSLEVVATGRDLLLREFSHPIQISEICSELDVSRRALQSHYRAILGVGPLRYQHLLRLGEAQRQLLQRGHELQVKDVLCHVGLRHAGRFSGEYHELFGELPLQARTGIPRKR